MALSILGISCLEDRSSPSADDYDEEYDVVIAICHERLESTEDMCERIESSTGDQVTANVLFGLAGGHQVNIGVALADGSIAYESDPATVPENRRWLDGVSIERQRVCQEADCRVTVYALVDGAEVASVDFEFVS